MLSERDRRLIRIVEEALNERPESRESFLLQAVEGDETLLAEASELLAQTTSATGFLSSWAAGKAAELVRGYAAGTLSPGGRLGPYSIERKLGSGGMGEVYEATDLRLRRRVAIKVLTGVADDPDARAHILREARALSRLGHASICTIHDVGMHDGTPYLVMELLEGFTLRAALQKQGRLPVPTAMEWSIQIAEALHAAHQRGVVHRDLKPENIIITRTGAKLIDFGIAALVAQSAAPHAAGTLPYMSPEQIRREPPGAQSDLFAFGAILYEMVVGRPAFAGDREAIMKAILDGGGPVLNAENAPHLPAGLRDLVDCGLTRLPEQRWQSAFDAAATLRSVQRGWPAPSAAHSVARWRMVALAVVGLGLFGAAATALWWRYGPSSSAGQPVTFSVRPEPGVEFVQPLEIALSPDGKAIAYTGSDQKTTHIYVRRFAELHAYRVAGTDQARRAFWSPDGSALGFFSDGKLKRVPSGGGPPVIVCDASQGLSGSWGRRGGMLFSNVSGPVMWVDATGGTPRAVTRLNAAEEEGSHRWPVFLRDGTHFLYTARSNRHEGRLFAGSTAGGNVWSVVDAPSGTAVGRRLYYLRGTSLISREFDDLTMQAYGDTSAIAESVGVSSYSVSDTGVVAYWGGVKVAPAPLLWMDRSGKPVKSLGPPALYAGIVSSPSGHAFAVTVCESIDCADPTSSSTVRRYNLRILSANGDSVQFTNDEVVAALPVWSPKGDELIYGSTRGGRMDLYRRKVAGGPERVVLSSGSDVGSTSWSRDGRFVAYTELSLDSRFDIWIADLSTGKARPFLKTPASETLAAFSPNGKWVAYTSDVKGYSSLYVLPFSPEPATWGKAKPIAITAGQGDLAIWKGDGSELSIQSGWDVASVSVSEQSGTIRFGPPRRLFRLRRLSTMGSRFAVSPDAQRFLILDGPVQADSGVTVRIPSGGR